MSQRNYKAYLGSKRWKSTRARIMLRSGGLCERCGKEQAIDVHHLTYDRLGDELDGDLVALCRPCHGFSGPPGGRVRQPDDAEARGPDKASGSVPVPRSILFDATIRDRAKILYILLAHYADEDSVCCCASSKLCQDLGVRPRRLFRAVSELKKLGLISIRQRGNGRSPEYTLLGG